MSDDDDRERTLHLHVHLDGLTINVVHTADDAMLSLVNSIKQDIATMSNNVDAAILQLQGDVTQESTVDASVITLLNGIPALIATAVAAAVAAGATPAQVASFQALSTTMQANATALAQAVTANTPKPAA